MTRSRQLPRQLPRQSPHRVHGFTLIELLAALFILALLALLSYRGLGAVLDARAHIQQEAEKWRRVAAFCARFGQDVQLAAPRPVRSGFTQLPAWHGLSAPGASGAGPRLAFSRFASAEGLDMPRRVAYRLNDRQEVELWLWPGLDVAADVVPVRHVLLAGVTKLDIEYLNADLAWVETWPALPGDAVIPRAVRLRFFLAAGGEITRVFALHS